MRTKVIIGISVTLFAILLGWLYVESTKPLPGEKTPQEGREHDPEGSPLSFDYNPPTGGNHYASWITKGFYDEPRNDGNLVHSLEHGYIIFWYNCDRRLNTQNSKLKNLFGGIITSVSAHFEEGKGVSTPSASVDTEKKDDLGRTAMTGGSEGSPSAHFNDMPKSFSDGSCDSFKSELKSIYEKIGPRKLILVPRVNTEYPLILTSWGRTLKLSSVDEEKIKEFVNAYRDNGPEHTNEP